MELVGLFRNFSDGAIGHLNSFIIMAKTQLAADQGLAILYIARGHQIDRAAIDPHAQAQLRMFLQSLRDSRWRNAPAHPDW